MKDFTQPDPPALGRKPSGCKLGCLAMLFMPVLLVLLGYAVVFHSSVPITWLAKKFAGSISSNGNSVEMRGIGGSLASGISFEEIILHGDAGNSTITGLTFRYNGLLDAIRQKRLVIEELSIGRSDIMVSAGFLDVPTGDEETGDPDGHGDAPASNPSGGGTAPALFELRELRFENTRIRSADGEMDLGIPLVRLAGLKIAGDDFELAELEVTSDYLNLELVDAGPELIEGQMLPFSRKVQGRVLPDIHPRVISEFDFSVELAAVQGRTRSRVTAFGGALRQTLLPRGSVVRFDSLTLGDYFDTKGYVTPERFTMTARESGKVVDIGPGEFFLGATRFEIAGQQVDADDPESAILGTAEISGRAITVRIRPDKRRMWSPFAVELESEPEMPQPELLARIYFQRAYEELEPDEQARVDDLAATKTDRP